MQHLGGPVKTYAHRKGRSRVSHISSPLNAADGEGLSLVEMTRRMKKRARQSINSPRPDHEKSLNSSQKLLKRPKNTHATATTFPSDPDSICSTSAFPLDLSTSLDDGTKNLQYQTPFNLSPAGSPTIPDSMSPVPPRRHLPGTGSRNLKENKSVKRLASPFHSRSVSQACSRACSRTNSPKNNLKKPPFYIKTRTRSEANAHPCEHMPNEGSFPVSGSLPTLGSMKTTVCGPSLDDSSTAYMLQNLSGQDWLRPAKALSRTPFPEDYVPPGTPFQELVFSSETFLEGVPLQTSTPNVVKSRLQERLSTKTIPSSPNTPDFSHSPDGANNNLISSLNEASLGSHRRTRRRSNHDSIFSSSFDASTMSPTSIFWSGCINTESTLKSDPVFSTAAYPPDSAQAVVNLSGMLDDLDIDGKSHSCVCWSFQTPLHWVIPHSTHTIRLRSSWLFSYAIVICGDSRCIFNRHED
ncbi:hypothetical protein BC827DRAFT_1197556 [Russula dissimulans]|jgi:hypothetical protein|nr:hypothetical protein BC827DRAFT_1197556 [Russula dissimulans]